MPNDTASERSKPDTVRIPFVVQQALDGVSARESARLRCHISRAQALEILVRRGVEVYEAEHGKLDPVPLHTT